MLAICDDCNFLFEDKYHYNFGNSTNINLKSNYLPCPKCNGEKAHLLDGTFNFNENSVIAVLSAPEFTYKVLRELNVLVEQVHKGEISQRQFKRKASKISPSVKFLLDLISNNKQQIFLMVIGLLVNILPGIIKSKQPITKYNIEQHIHIDPANAPNSIEKPDTIDYQNEINNKEDKQDKEENQGIQI